LAHDFPQENQYPIDSFILLFFLFNRTDGHTGVAPYTRQALFFFLLVFYFPAVKAYILLGAAFSSCIAWAWSCITIRVD
jgi:hypothetical protein